MNKNRYSNNVKIPYFRRLSNKYLEIKFKIKKN